MEDRPDAETVLGETGALPEESAAEGQAADAPAEPDLAAALAAERQRAAEYLDALQRLKADFDNYRRRMLSEQGRWQENAVGAFLATLLPVVDNLERAVAAAGDAEAVRQGVELTLRQLREVLAKAGLEPMEAVGQTFDPTRHEAMAQVESAAHREGEITAEFRRGYLFKGQVLRPALVQVAKAPAAVPQEQPAESGDGRTGEGGSQP
jgi:molecular chaperone GrpE